MQKGKADYWLRNVQNIQKHGTPWKEPFLSWNYTKPPAVFLNPAETNQKILSKIL